MIATTLRLRPRRTAGVFTGLLLVLLTLGLTGAQAASATDYTWTGAVLGGQWSDAANWAGGVAPSGSVGTLIFPQLTAAAGYYDPLNNETSLATNAFAIDDNEPYDLNGNGFSIGAGGLAATPDTNTSSLGTPEIAAAIDLAAAQTWSVEAGTEGDGLEVQDVDSVGTSDYALTVDFTSQDAANPAFLDILGDANVGAATFSGNGEVLLGNPAGGSPGELNDFNGNPITIENGAGLFAPNADASVGPLSVTDGDLGVGEGVAPEGDLSIAGDLTLASSDQVYLYIDQPGTIAGDDYSQLTGTGTIDLAGATLNLGQGANTDDGCSDLNVGDVDTLISSPDGVTGTFAGIANGGSIPIQNECDDSTSDAVATINYTTDSVTATITSAGNAGDVPQPTAAPTITGTAQVDYTLTASTGTWTGSPTSYTYQWYSCTSTACNPISGATASTYAPTAAVVGDEMAVEVTATNSIGSNYADSNPTKAVAAAPPLPTNTAAPVISGTGEAGDVLSVSTGTWNSSPTSYGYEWERCNNSGADCSVISGATTSSYTLAAADIGHRIIAEVDATNVAGTSSFVGTAGSAIIAASVIGSSAPTITGVPFVGEELTAHSGTFSGTGLKYLYVWEKCPTMAVTGCALITGATGQTYTISSAVGGDRIRVVEAAYNTSDAALEASGLTGLITNEADLKTALSKLLLPGATTAKLAKAGAHSFTVTAPVAGKLALTWTLKGYKIASGSVSTAGGRTTLKLKLTSKGKRLLKAAKKATKISATASYTLAGSTPITTSKKLTLRR